MAYGTVEHLNSLFFFSGDYSGVNNQYQALNLVEIYCKSCDSFKGATIAYPLASTRGFDGTTTHFSIAMTETSGWMKDPQNTLHERTMPTNAVLSKYFQVKRASRY
jgi:hypothetical protein